MTKNKYELVKKGLMLGQVGIRDALLAAKEGDDKTVEETVRALKKLFTDMDRMLDLSTAAAMTLESIEGKRVMAPIGRPVRRIGLGNLKVVKP